MRLKTAASLFLASLMCLVMAASVMAGGAFAGDKVPRMDAPKLVTMLDSPDVLIIDVRRGKDWEGSELMIKNAHRKAYNDVDAWMAELPKDKTIVLYCA